MNASRFVEASRLWARVWAHRRGIVALVAAATVVVGVVAFLMPPWYRAQASLLPPGEEESGLGLANLLKGFGVPGLKVQTQATPADVFMAVLDSRRLHEGVVRRFDLKRRYHKRLMVDAVRELQRHARFKLTEAGIIQISVEDTDPRQAAAMANAYIELLDRFNREVRMTKGRRTRLFVEQRLAETKVDLSRAEQRLAEYQSQHKAVALTPEVSTAVETAARMYAERAALQVRLGVVQGYTRGSTDEELQIRQQLAQIDRQLRQLPETGLEVARLLRDVKTLEQLYALLTAQYEEARIEEARDVATVEVLDVATPPERKSRPKRLVMIASAMMLSLAIGVASVLLREEGRGESHVRGAEPA
jgi:uncharacterized protein involved in exopolysaccharide biosynthesis